MAVVGTHQLLPFRVGLIAGSSFLEPTQKEPVSAYQPSIVVRKAEPKSRNAKKAAKERQLGFTLYGKQDHQNSRVLDVGSEPAQRRTTVRSILMEPGPGRGNFVRTNESGTHGTSGSWSWAMDGNDLQARNIGAQFTNTTDVNLARRSFSHAFASTRDEVVARHHVATPGFLLDQSDITQHEAASDSEELETDDLWLQIRTEAREMAEAEPALASYLYSTILAHRSLEKSLAFHLANKLGSSTLLSTQLFSLIADTFMEDKAVSEALRADMRAVKARDAACETYTQCLLNFKGYLAIQSHRVAHRLWGQGRRALATALQSRSSEAFHVDIHPAAKLGKGFLLDHATGVVIGETAEIGNDVSLLHHVTLGGTGAVVGDRHPKVRDGVLIGAGATILGNVIIGEGAKIGAGSMVLTDIPPHTTAVGNPARLMGGKEHPAKLKEIPSETMDHTSFVGEWSHYVI